MNRSFEKITALPYSLKAAERQIQAFQSGEKYVQLEKQHRKLVRSLEETVKKLKRELEEAHRELVRSREKWFEASDDLEKEYEKKIKKYESRIKKLLKRTTEIGIQRDTALERNRELERKVRELEAALEEEKGKNRKLTAQLNRDYENSSLPSSVETVKKKKITNSRETSGKKPGGQPGHTGHCRKKQEPTEVPVHLPQPAEAVEDADFRKTKKTIVKQAVGIRVVLDVKEYHADVYYNPKTGERVHAAFPEGVVNDVNYDGSIKAFLFLLNNDCCVSIDKCRKFLSDLTGGKLNISKGMINTLTKEFAKKTENEQKELYHSLLCSPVMHTDCTNARENGKNVYVYVCTAPDGRAMYFAREKKGHEGVKGTVTEDYQGILVHDHDMTFYSYGSGHQECLAHILRYLKDSMENEPERSWNSEMHALIREMIHYRNSLDTGTACNEAEVSGFEERYRQILQKGKKEYEAVPASKYYRDGYNLCQRMEKLMDNHLLFLHDIRVPANNNQAERCLRNYKRKQKQAMSFRSFESLDHLCRSMSMLVEMRKNETNIFDKVSMIFG